MSEVATQRRSVRKSTPSKAAGKRQPRYKRMASNGLESGKQFYEFMQVKGIPLGKEWFAIALQYAGVAKEKAIEHKTMLIALAVGLVMIALAGMFLIGYLWFAGYFPTVDQITAAAKYAADAAVEFPDKVPRGILPRAYGAVTGAIYAVFSFVCSVLGISERMMIILIGGVVAIVIACIPPAIFMGIAALAWLEVLSYDHCQKIGLGDFFVKWGVIETYKDE